MARYCHSCMVVLALSRLLWTAFAWSSSSIHTFSVLGHSLPRSNTLLYSKSIEKSDDETKVPTTGWNHNQPRDSSTFWKNNTDGLATNGINSETTSEESKTEPRTGWLHNTESPSTSKQSQSPPSNKAQRRLQQAMKQQAQNHRIVAPPTFHAIGNGKRVVVTEHVISLPVNRNSNNKENRMDVYFSIAEVAKTRDEVWWEQLASLTPQKRAQSYIQKASLQDASDMLVYLQGGPGFGSPTPLVSLGFSKDTSWAATALNHYSRIVLMDQRGTGRSSPVTKQTLQKRFPNLFLLDHAGNDLSFEDLDKTHPNEAQVVREALQEATTYMSCLRADNIVLDAEEIKDALLMPFETQEDEVPRPYGAALGQSFGGFCILTYLSQTDHPPNICLLTGGIAPMLTPVHDVYNVLWERVKERNLRYYDMYPGDVAVVKNIVRTLLENPATLPSGGKLTARRFLQLGLGLGGSPSAFASMHALLSSAFVEEAEFSKAFLKRMDSEQSFDDHPIYFLLHESIYANGPACSPTNWAAHRAYQQKVKMTPEFDYTATSHEDNNEPTLFFGEMVFPWMAHGDYAELSGFGMNCLAESLASKDDWTPIYDGQHMKQVLSSGTKAAAAVYLEDLYVDFDASMKLVKRGGPMEKCKVWVTNEFQHSGLRDNGSSIFAKLLGMANGSIRTPS